MPLFAHFFPSVSVLSVPNGESGERKDWWASEILSNPNHLAAGVPHTAQDAEYLSLRAESGKYILGPCVDMKLSSENIPIIMIKML